MEVHKYKVQSGAYLKLLSPCLKQRNFSYSMYCNQKKKTLNIFVDNTTQILRTYSKVYINSRFLKPYFLCMFYGLQCIEFRSLIIILTCFRRSEEEIMVVSCTRRIIFSSTKLRDKRFIVRVYPVTLIACDLAC